MVVVLSGPAPANDGVLSRQGDGELTKEPEKLKIRGVLHLWRTVRLVWRIAPGWTLANAALAVVQGVLPLGAIYLMKLIIGSVTTGIGAADKGAAFGHTVILISHRFSTVRTADRIHILGEGRIRESGSHDELIALGGKYAEMYEVQARGFQ